MKFPKIKVPDLGTKQLGKTIQRNSPAILTGVGVVGLVGTAYLSGKASYEAAGRVRDARIDKAVGEELTPGKPLPDLTKTEKVQLLWQLYMPAIGVGTLSCAAIICSNRISTRRTAAMTTALAISERAYSEYKEKTEEIVGKTKEEKIRTAVAQDKLDALSDDHPIIATGKGDVLFMDAYSGRLFLSSMEEVKAAINNVNAFLLKEETATLSDLYDWLALDHTAISNDIGWMYHPGTTSKLIDPKFTTAMANGNKPCIVLDFIVAPVHNFDRFPASPRSR